MAVTLIQTSEAPQAIGPYSQALSLPNGLIYCSGQIPLDPQSMQVVSEDVEKQTEQVFKNIRAVLSAAKCDLNQVVKTTVFLKNMSDFVKMNAIYEKQFGAHKPARSTVEVARLPKDVLVEIEVIAFRG